MKDNLITIIMTQTDSNGVLSRLTVEYPDLENAAANAINLGYVDALVAKAREFAETKAQSGGKR